MHERHTTLRRFPHIAFALVILVMGVAAGPVLGQEGAGTEWRSHSADNGATKYSSLDQITSANFEDLEIAWRWDTADTHLSWSTPSGPSLLPADTVFDFLEAENPERWADWDGVNRSLSRPSIRALVATPLMVDGVLYVTTALYRGAAIDARTGRTLWVHDPRAYESGSPPPLPWRHRGPAYWASGAEARLFWGTGDGYLVAVDAATGVPAADFGEGGRVDLYDGLPRATRGQLDALDLLPLGSQSPPVVVGDTVIIGSSINDRALLKEAPPGWVRAYDVRTGRHKWDFHTVPQSADEFGADTWLNDSWRYSGNTNVWSLMSADNELGLVYLPIGTATNDYYGGDRLGDNLFSESLVAVDAETGERQWHFQMVHHGLWDYDLPAAPNLMNLRVEGRDVRAVAQVSKQGFVYTFDRVTGEPIWPIEERQVATDTDLDGEVVSPTQPFPTRPAAFEYQGTSIDDLIDFTPEIRQMAIDAVDGFRIGPLFTPQVLAGTIMRPSVGGGANWSGAAADPETGLLYIPSVNTHSTIGLSPPGPGEEQATLRYLRRSLSAGPVMPRGLPLWKPPYSRMTAIDMNSGEHAWMTPLGAGDRIRNHPMLRELDLPPLGGDWGRTGPLLTRTLLIQAMVAGGSEGGPRLAAYDKVTGEEIGSLDLPSGVLGAPMTYQLEGTQYLAMTLGGEVPGLIALRLPR